MQSFQLGATIICSVEIKDNTGVLKDPNSDTHHTMIKITDKNGIVVVAETTEMVNDSTGKYHYDYLTQSPDGIYSVKYIATDGSRVTIKTDTFIVEV